MKNKGKGVKREREEDREIIEILSDDDLASLQYAQPPHPSGLLYPNPERAQTDSGTNRDEKGKDIREARGWRRRQPYMTIYLTVGEYDLAAELRLMMGAARPAFSCFLRCVPAGFTSVHCATSLLYTLPTECSLHLTFHVLFSKGLIGPLSTMAPIALQRKVGVRPMLVYNDITPPILPLAMTARWIAAGHHPRASTPKPDWVVNATAKAAARRSFRPPCHGDLQSLHFIHFSLGPHYSTWSLGLVSVRAFGLDNSLYLLTQVH